jgi:hypothetical protein
MSQILDRNQSVDLINLCGFSSKEKWTLLHRGTRDGFGSKDFAKCADKTNTLTIYKAKKSGYIFGGFTKTAWSRDYNRTGSRESFLFTLTNADNEPCKIEQTSLNETTVGDLDEIEIYEKTDIILEINSDCDSCNSNVSNDNNTEKKAIKNKKLRKPKKSLLKLNKI